LRNGNLLIPSYRDPNKASTRISFTKLANERVVKAAQKGIEENPAAVIFFVDTFESNCYFIIKQLSEAEVRARAASGPSAQSAPALPAPVARRRGGPVLEVAVRRLKENVDVSAFDRARSRFVGLLRQQRGVQADGEFEAVMTLANSLDLVAPNGTVRVGMTQYASSDDFERAMGALANSREFNDFIQMVDIECFAVVEAVGQTVVNLATFPAAPMASSVNFKRVKAESASEYNRLNANFVNVFAGLDGVLGAGEFVAYDDDAHRLGAASYESLDAVGAAFADQFRDADTPAYFNTFERQCYYVLQRIN